MAYHYFLSNAYDLVLYKCLLKQLCCDASCDGHRVWVYKGLWFLLVICNLYKKSEYTLCIMIMRYGSYMVWPLTGFSSIVILRVITRRWGSMRTILKWSSVVLFSQNKNDTSIFTHFPSESATCISEWRHSEPKHHLQLTTTDGWGSKIVEDNM